MEWLEEVKAKSVWEANRFFAAPGSDGRQTRISALKEKVNGRIVRELQDDAEKSRMLHAMFFKDPPVQEEDDEAPQYLAPAFEFEPIQLTNSLRSIGPSEGSNHTKRWDQAKSQTSCLRGVRTSWSHVWGPSSGRRIP
ncbi:hypothetical protein K443DRAFT_15393 [Laccaria amethystina LaAM-08-1]|uniref:Uncharacterized protein n=1 Tax=Laccaria amethystina LaAM-08-1 TaxID=1095629 RepID=A0A0C9WGY5_9AGAR|nr:hypothetical protein K443DRAFT_15393 [Laccaria amethystina LaAM-08-1]